MQVEVGSKLEIEISKGRVSEQKINKYPSQQEHSCNKKSSNDQGKNIQEILTNCIDMKYYKKNQLSKLFLTYQNQELEDKFLNRHQKFSLAKILIAQSFIWNMLLVIMEQMEFLRVFQAVFDVVIIIGYYLVPRRFKQYMILLKQLLVTYLICIQLTVEIPGWRSLMNGAAFIMWVLVEYQNIRVEAVGILTSIIFSIVILEMKWFHSAFFLFAAFILIGYRYSYDKQERLLFLALQNFQEWQKVVEKTMPAYFFVQSFFYRNHSMELYDSNKKFYNDFIKENQAAVGKNSKQDFKNEIYLQFLKEVKIIGSNQRAKRFSTTDTINMINSNNRQEDIQSLFSYLLQKHVEVYEWWLENIKNNKFNQNQSNNNKSPLRICCEKIFFCFNKKSSQKNDEQQLPIGLIPSPRVGQIPQSLQGIVSKCDISVNSGAGGGARTSNQKYIPTMNESMNVIYYNKKLDKNQYFKVNIVPLFLHEPFLSISFQDVSEFQLIKEKQIREKGLGLINYQAQVFIKGKLEQIEKKLNGQANKLFKSIRKKITLLKEIVNLQQRSDKVKVEFESFQLSEVLEQLIDTFPNIKALNIENNIAQNESVIDLKQNLKKVQSFDNHQFINKPKTYSTSLSCSDLQNYDENIESISNVNSNKSQQKTENDSSVPVFGKDGNIINGKKISSRMIPSLQNVKTIHELQIQTSVNQLLSTENNQSMSHKSGEYKKQQKQDEYFKNKAKKNFQNQNEDSFSNILMQNQNYSKLNNLNGFHRRDDIDNQNQSQNNTNINFSFEILNNNNNNTTNHNLTQLQPDYSFRGESPTQLFSKRIPTQKIQKQLGDTFLIQRNKEISHSILMSEEASPTKMPPVSIYDKLCQNSNKFYKQIKQSRYFQIFNDRLLLQQVLVGIASSFGGEDIILSVNKVENKWYKSIQFTFQYQQNIHLFENANNQHSLSQIFGVKGNKYDLLKNKLLENLNQIILLICPNKFKLNGNKIEIEFYYLKQNLLS